MNNRSPFFSIVIPTRNRAELLCYALESALQQHFEDYEIVVSNNCSDDETEAVVHSFPSDRVRYVRTSTSLSMADHWEFALSNAKGQYISFLCDDDALSPHLLGKAAKVIEQCPTDVVIWQACFYFHPTWYDDRFRNCLKVPAYSGRVFDCGSRSTLEDLFAFRRFAGLPKMVNSMCHREVLSRIRNNISRVFLPPAPDFTVGVATLSETSRFILIDQMLVIAGAADKSIGANATFRYTEGQSVKAFLQEFGDRDVLPHLPFKIHTVSSHFAESLYVVKEKIGDALSGIEVDFGGCLLAVYRDLLFLEEGGIDVTHEKQEVFAAAAQQPAFVRDVIRKAALKRRIRRFISDSPVLTRMESLVRPSKDRFQPTLIRGEEAGFSNILECASRLDTILARRKPADNRVRGPALPSEQTQAKADQILGLHNAEICESDQK